jgi:hypothetical protein
MHALTDTYIHNIQMEKVYPDGSKEVIFPDKTRKHFLAGRTPTGTECLHAFMYIFTCMHLYIYVVHMFHMRTQKETRAWS